jgi:SAM-dependent methyltransferase
VFERCYTQLYSELGWLNELSDAEVDASPSVAYGHWVDVIGAPPQNVYEVGSGKGALIRYLANCGFRCKATEITHERGEKWVVSHPNLSWGISDGVHLDRFEPPGCYDVVISVSVIEHLHPDDLIEHFRGALHILADAGRYILSTPHAYGGPSDVSRVFGCQAAKGMHLKEYTYNEIAYALNQAGFGSVSSVLRFPAKIRRLFGKDMASRSSRAYLTYLRTIEGFIGRLPAAPWRQRAAGFSRLLLFSPNMMIVGSRHA